MSTYKRLSEVFHSAKRIPFNEYSRVVFFSDIHRGDNSWADEFARNRLLFMYALQYYLDEGYTYIEVGDGDELSKNPDFAPILDAHPEVFEQLRRFHNVGRLHLIFGNHDIQRKHPHIVNQSLHQWHNPLTLQWETLLDRIEVHEGLVLENTTNGQQLFVVHGHQGDLWNDTLGWISQLLLGKLWRRLQLLGLQDPTSVANNRYMQSKVERKLIEWVAARGQPTLCGHTHRHAFPKSDEPPYFNTGSCVHPRWITGIEILEGNIMLVRWMIRPSGKGFLQVERDVIAGPRALHEFYPPGSPTEQNSIPVYEPYWVYEAEQDRVAG